MTEKKLDRMIELLEQIAKNTEVVTKFYQLSIASAMKRVNANEKLKKYPKQTDEMVEQITVKDSFEAKLKHK